MVFQELDDRSASTTCADIVVCYGAGVIKPDEIQHVVTHEQPATVPPQTTESDSLFREEPRVPNGDERAGRRLAFRQDRQPGTANFLNVLLQPIGRLASPFRRIIRDDNCRCGLCIDNDGEF